jgi:hypothetical protein
MSIFGFLKEMFFCRTEKSGKKLLLSIQCENGKENINDNVMFFKNFGK